MSVRYRDVCALLHTFLNISLIFQDTQVCFLGKHSPDSQLQNLLSQNIIIANEIRRNFHFFRMDSYRRALFFCVLPTSILCIKFEQLEI